MAAPIVIVGGILLRLAAKKVLQQYLKRQSKQTLKRLAKKGGKICRNCKQRVKCFKKGKKGNDEEFDRQLEMQEAALNNLTPDELETALKNFKGRPSDGAARASERLRAERELSSMLDAELEKGGMGAAERRSAVKSEVGRMMKGLDALHTLDWGGGGDGSMSGVGPKSENRSIGGNWPARRQELLDMAKDAKEDGADKMNIKLQRCKPGV